MDTNILFSLDSRDFFAEKLGMADTDAARLARLLTARDELEAAMVSRAHSYQIRDRMVSKSEATALLRYYRQEIRDLRKRLSLLEGSACNLAVLERN